MSGLAPGSRRAGRVRAAGRVLAHPAAVDRVLEDRLCRKPSMLRTLFGESPEHRSRRAPRRRRCLTSRDLAAAETRRDVDALHVLAVLRRTCARRAARAAHAARSATSSTVGTLRAVSRARRALLGILQRRNSRSACARVSPSVLAGCAHPARPCGGARARSASASARSRRRTSRTAARFRSPASPSPLVIRWRSRCADRV